MATLADIRAGLAQALSAIPGVQANAYATSAPTPPCFFVQPDDITYDTALRRGYDTWRMRVTGLAALTFSEGGQMVLDQWLATAGANSVKAALETDVTLGGVAETLTVQSVTGYRTYQREAGGVALGAEWTVLVYARGDT
jgi:hypothetical protein